MKLIQKYLLFLFSLIVILSLLFINQNIVSAKTQRQTTSENWMLYTDARFNYSFEYPENWKIQYRNDTPGTYGEPLLIYPDGVNENAFGIYVGSYSTPIQNNESLLEWTNQYNQLMDTFNLLPHEVTSITSAVINGKDGVKVTLDVASFTNIRVGDVVWFVWSNIDQTTNQDYVAIYEHVVASLVFAESSPRSLTTINGKDVGGQSLGELAEINARSTNSVIAALANTTFRLPFVGFHYVTLGPGCLPTHTGISGEAIDYGLNIGEEVLPGEKGNVIFAGWNTYGYGNLVKIDHGGGYVSYYGHLSYINVSAGTIVDKGWTLIGQSGNTGNSSGPHLHFEVQNNGNAYSVRNMAGQTLYSPTCDSNRQYDGTATGPSKEQPRTPTSTPQPATFHKLMPANGVTIPLPSNSSYLLQWENNQSDWFDYCIDQINDNQCNSSWIPRKSYSGPDQFTLAAGNTYYWQVKRENSGVLADNGTWWSFTVQSIPKVFSIALANSSPTNAASVNFTVTFSEPVTGVDPADFILTGITSASVSAVTGSGSTRTVTVNTGTGDGTIQLNLVYNDSIINGQGILLGGVGVGNGNYSGPSYTIDKTAPRVESSVGSVVRSDLDLIKLRYMVTFSEKVTGVAINNFNPSPTATNVTVESVTDLGSGTVYIVIVNNPGKIDNYFHLDVVNYSNIVDGASNPLDGGVISEEPYTKMSACVWPLYTAPTKPTFADVPMSLSYWSWVERLSNTKITSGCGAGNFCPGDIVNRAQMSIFLLRAKYCGNSYTPRPVGSSSGFKDVLANVTYAPWVKQLAAEGITAGCGNGNFCPADPVNRAQMSIFLLRAKHGGNYIPPSIGGSSGFNDVPVDATYAPWAKQLVAEGITAGCGNGNFCPGDNVNRASMAIFLVRAFGLP